MFQHQGSKTDLTVDISYQYLFVRVTIQWFNLLTQFGKLKFTEQHHEKQWQINKNIRIFISLIPQK